MIKSMKTALLIAIPLTIVITGCGGGSSNDGDNPTPENSKNQGNIEAEESKFNYDLAQMSQLNAAYTNSSGAAPLWYTRISINGDEVSKQEGVGIEDLKAALGAISFKNYDVVRTEITVKGTNESILATNLKKVAATDEKLGKIWNDECSFIDEPEHEISDTDYEFIDGENRLVMKVDICDFYGFSLKPVMQIKPQKKNLAKKLVIYHCAFEPDNISTSQSSPYIEKYSSDTPCG